MDIMEYSPYNINGFEGFDEILAQDVLDHVTHIDAVRLIERFYIWMNTNGVLNIHLPNFEHCAKKAINGGHEAMCWIYGSDGNRAYYETNIIRWGYTPKTIRELLKKQGFIVISEEDTCNGYGFRTLATKRE